MLSLLPCSSGNQQKETDFQNNTLFELTLLGFVLIEVGDSHRQYNTDLLQVTANIYLRLALSIAFAPMYSLPCLRTRKISRVKYLSRLSQCTYLVNLRLLSLPPGVTPGN